MIVVSRQGAAALAAVSAGLTAAVLAPGAAAQAQGYDTYPVRPFTVKVGGYLPSSHSTRQDLGINWYDFGATYDFRTTGNKLPSTYSVYVDYFNRSKYTGPSGGRLRSQGKVFDIGLSDRYYFEPKLAALQPFVGAGFGIYDVRAYRNTAAGNANQYKTGIGAKIMTGAELRSGLMGEVEYTLMPEPRLVANRINLSGYRIRFGYKF